MLVDLYAMERRDMDFYRLLYTRDAQLESPMHRQTGRDSIKYAFDGMDMILDDAQVVDYHVDQDSEGRWVCHILMSVEVFGQRQHIATAARLTLRGSGDELRIARHEDLWSENELPNSNTMGIMGGAAAVGRQFNGALLSIVFKLRTALESLRAGYHGRTLDEDIAWRRGKQPPQDR